MTKKTRIAKTQYAAVGRRKKAIARVRLTSGSGSITVNKLPIEEYFPSDAQRFTVRQPLELINATAKYDVSVNVTGGGTIGQAGATRHGIARALCEADPDLKQELKTAGFLKRDSRMKERKKYGLHKARKAPQFSKR